MDQLPSVRHASGLLDMLAEVASQTLHSDPSVKTSPAKKKALERAAREKPREKPEPKESLRRKAVKVCALFTSHHCVLQVLIFRQPQPLCYACL